MSGSKVKKEPYKSEAQAPWTLLDISIILIFTLFGGVVLYEIIFLSFNDQIFVFKIFTILFTSITIIFPYLWLRNRYNIKWKSLGVRYGKYSIIVSLVFGASAAFCLFLIVRLTPFLYDVALKSDTIQTRNIFAIVLTPFTLTGFTKFILGPLGEEILLRGVVYAYFRGRLGIIFGTFSQALISTMLHPYFIIDAFHSNQFFSAVIYMFFIHTTFSLLYEKSNSLYPSMICHGLLNYLLLIY